MSKVIRKKVLSRYYEKIAKGEKTFELRLANWDCQPGDKLMLIEIDDKSKVPTGRSIERTVGWVGRTKDSALHFWPEEDVDKYGYQIISLVEPAAPKVGIGVFLIKDGSKILLGKRKSSHGDGEYALPGGHLEVGETFEECVLRGLAEEAGTAIKVKVPEFLCLTNLRRYSPKHYADIGMLAEWISGEAEVTEPDKKESWEWYDLDNLPAPLFGCTNNYIEAYKTGRKYFKK